MFIVLAVLTGGAGVVLDIGWERTSTKYDTQSANLSNLCSS